MFIQLYLNILSQSNIDNVFEQASISIKTECKNKESYNKWTSVFDARTRQNYHTCIKNSNDENFKKAAARYILVELEKNKQNPDLSDLKKLLEESK